MTCHFVALGSKQLKSTPKAQMNVFALISLGLSFPIIFKYINFYSQLGKMPGIIAAHIDLLKGTGPDRIKNTQRLQLTHR